MTEPKPTRPAVFIEKIFPVTLLNKQVYYEHGGNPFKGLHRWYSRKPLSFSRASVLGSLLPDTVTMEEFEYLLGLNRRVAGHPDSTTKLYKTPPSPERIKQVHDLCEQTWGTRTPTVLDAFAGGGSIPFEAVRYGLNVLASDLNPVAVVTMKAAMEYPLKFGPDLQHEIDKWVKWVGDEAEKRLAEFFPSQEGERIQNYLWAHTIECPNCQLVLPLSPNWWLYNRPETRNLHKWCAVKPVPAPDSLNMKFEIIKGKKGKKKTIELECEEFNPDDYITWKRGTGKCTNCGFVIENEAVKSQAREHRMGHQMYAVSYRSNDSELKFRLPNSEDLRAFEAAKLCIEDQSNLEIQNLIPTEKTGNYVGRINAHYYGCEHWYQMFNPRQLLTLTIYTQVINDAKSFILNELDPIKAQSVIVYLSLVLDRCADANCRLVIYNTQRACIQKASTQHSLNLMWNYPEVNGSLELWRACQEEAADTYSGICKLFGIESNLLDINNRDKGNGSINVSLASTDNLEKVPNKSIFSIVTDPPYYSTIQYSELSDFFYVWMKRVLGDILPHIFELELTDKNREAVANASRFYSMGTSSEELANRDYEAKMALAFAEYFRVLRDDGVMTVQFNHKDSGAWDVLAKSLIDAGFEITASWAVSTENPQNLHQAQKNSVSSTVLLVCRKRDPNAGSAWWDDLRPELANLVEQRAPEFEANDIGGIDLYLSAFGPALNVFSRAWPVLDSSGVEMRPEVAFGEARKAIANYRFRKLLEADTAGFDPLTQWYILAWDAFRAREFPFDEARQLALAVGGFNVRDLDKTHKLIDSASGTCKLLTPQQRLKKRAFSTNPDEFTAAALVDGLHAIIALYLEEQSIDPVRRFLKTTGLLSNDLFMRAWEVALKAIPHIGDERKRMVEEKALADLWLAMDEIQAKVLYVQPELELEGGQQSLNLNF
jgi:putative DNA methylase